jgi:hypothetical protein
MSENAKPTEDQDGSAKDNAAPAIGEDEQQADGGPGSHSEGGSGGAVDDAASGGVPEEADSDS